MNIDDIVKEVGLYKCSVCNEEAREYIRKSLTEYKDFIEKRQLKDEAFAELVSNVKNFYGDYSKDRKKRKIVYKILDFYKLFVDKIFDITNITAISKPKTTIEYKPKGMLYPYKIDVNCISTHVKDFYIDNVDLLIHDVIGMYRNSDKWKLCMYLPLYYDFNDNLWKSSFAWMYTGGFNNN